MTVDEQEEEFKAWDLPYVEDTNLTEENKTTNALNRKSGNTSLLKLK
jgi:flagellar assembly protein FliH